MSSGPETRIDFVINGLLPNIRNSLNDGERQTVLDHLWEIGSTGGDLSSDEKDFYNLAVDRLDV